MAGFALSQTSSLEDIDKAIKDGEEQLASIDLHPENFQRLDKLRVLREQSLKWYCKYIATSEIGVLEEAIRHLKAAINEMRPGYLYQGTGRMFSSLASWMMMKFGITGLEEDIDDVITNYGLSMEAEEPRNPRWWLLQQQLSSVMVTKLERFPTDEILQATIEFQLASADVEGLDTVDPVGCARFYRRLATLLTTRYQRSGDMGDLDEAVRLGYQAVNKLPSPDKAELEYISLSTILFIYYQRTYLTSSLDEAIRIAQVGLDLGIEEKDKEDFYHKYLLMTEVRNMRLGFSTPEGQIEALDRAIELRQRAIERLRREGKDGETWHHLDSLGFLLGEKMKKQDGDVTWGERGLEHQKAALEILRQVKERHPGNDEQDILEGMVKILLEQYNFLNLRGSTTEAIQKLDDAEVYASEALALTAENDRALCTRRKYLAYVLRDRGRDDDAQKALDLFMQGAAQEDASVGDRMNCARYGGVLAYRLGQYQLAHELLQLALSFLPEFNLQSLPRDDLELILTNVSDISGYAASAALESGRSLAEAIQSIEVGRSVISGLSLTSKADTPELRDRYPVVADQYDSLRSQLLDVSAQLNAVGSFQQARPRQQALMKEIELKEAEIRTLQGFELFQLPLTEDQIKGLASEGPLIVLNVSELRCDAMIVTCEKIKLVKLENMAYADLKEKMAIFQTLDNEGRRNARVRRRPRKTTIPADALIWLWDVAVKPILDVTDFGASKRVWWITSGMAGHIPLHAAGRHTENSTDNTLSHAVSSYISSLKGLYYARQKKPSLDPVQNMLLVTMKSNPAPHRDLVTKYEENAIQNVFADSLRHLDQPDPATVLESLPAYSFVHLACHGLAVAHSPSQSGLLLLKDGKAAILAIADIDKINIKGGSVAYLSACSTAEQSDGTLLADEAIHLANTFQTLGFQHVIGTMWGADDRAAGKLAEGFYRRLTLRGPGLSADGVAQALHDSMLEFRESTGLEGQDVLAWGPFVHIGV